MRSSTIPDEGQPADEALTRLDARARGTLAVLCTAVFLDALDVSMMGVALPSIQADFDISTSSLQWVMSAYVLGYGGFLLLGGRAADLFGRRRMFLMSLTVFLIFSGLGGLATSAPLLIVARFITGVSAAFTAPAGLSIITTSFPEGPARNRALTIFTATGATGFSLGLVIGGVLTEASWRWVFFVPVILTAPTLLGALRLVPRDHQQIRSQGFDVAGAISLTTGMLLLVFTLVEAPEQGWGSFRTAGSFAVVAVIFAVFVAIEQRSRAPLVRLGLLRSGALVRANLGAMSLLGAWIGFLFTATLYMQQLRNWSAIETGFAVFPAGLLVALLAPRIAGPLVERFGTTAMIVAGLTSTAVAYALFLQVDLQSRYVTAMLPTFVLIGIGFALAYGPLNIMATNGVSHDEQGVAGGLVQTSLQLGPALCLAVVIAVGDSTSDQSPTAVLGGFHAALTVPLLVAVLGIIATASGLRRRRAEPGGEEVSECS